MKNTYYLAVILLSLIMTSCSTNNTSTNLEDLNNNKEFFDEDEPCLVVNLMAGQNIEIGTVAVAVVDDNFVITYTVIEDWLIYGTHLSVNNCEDDDFPTTGSGNPKVGHFEYSTNNDSGVTQVIYTISASDFEDRFCIAAHAEVVGPTGDESAWAEGEDFPGKNWAMYFEGSVLDCDEVVEPK